MAGLSTLKKQFAPQTTAPKRSEKKAKKTFPLLALPDIALERVLRAFEPMDRVDLSLTSKRMHAYCRTYQTIFPSRFYLGVGTVRMEFDEFPARVFEARVAEQHAWCTATQRRTIAGTTVCSARKLRDDSCYVNRKSDCVTTLWTDRLEGTVRWAYYLANFFHHRAVDLLVLDVTQFATTALMDQWVRRIGATKVMQLKGDCRRLDDARARHAIATYRGTRFLQVGIETRDGFRADETPIESEYLSVKHAHWFTLADLAQTTGSYVQLIGCTLTDWEVNTFLLSWLHGGNDRLRYLDLRRLIVRGEFDIGVVFRDVSIADGALNPDDERRVFPMMDQFPELRHGTFGVHDRHVVGGVDLFRPDGTRATVVFDPPPITPPDECDRYYEHGTPNRHSHMRFFVWPKGTVFASDAARREADVVDDELRVVHQLDVDAEPEQLIVQGQVVDGHVAAPNDGRRVVREDPEDVPHDDDQRVVVVNIRDNIHGFNG